MQIFVAGTWNDHKAEPFAGFGFAVGQQIALKGFDLACGPGTGMARHVIEGYRSVIHRGLVRFYLPAAEEMQRVGEVVGSGADEIIETPFDYPLRNIYQIKKSDALVIVTGGDGTLQEALTALTDYAIPVAAFRDSGTAVQALEVLLAIYPTWSKLLTISDDIQQLIAHVSHHVIKKS